MKRTSTFANDLTERDNVTDSVFSNDYQGQQENEGLSFMSGLFKKVKQIFVKDSPVQISVQEDALDCVSDFSLVEVSSPENLIADTYSNNVISFSNNNTPFKVSECNPKVIYQQNIQQMNLFTYLKRAINSNVESFNRVFLERSKKFLSVNVGSATDSHAPVSFANQVLGILSGIGGINPLGSKAFFGNRFSRTMLGACSLALLTSFSALATDPDLEVKKVIDNQMPAIGATVTYTITVKNAATFQATGVELTDKLPLGLQFVSATVKKGTGTYSAVTGIWTIGTIAGSSDMVLEIKATVLPIVKDMGVVFNTAEITKENEKDVDSVPNNGEINEDDIDAVCFSVPMFFYVGDEFKVAPPKGYTSVKWFKKSGANGTATQVVAGTVGAKIIAGDTLVISGGITDYTEFTFTATSKTCPANGCCPVKFLPGPYGSIGNFVFNDTNTDGLQTAGEPGVDGVVVELYDSKNVKIKTTTTKGGGKYLFDSLFTDTYTVKFIAPAGSTLSPAKQGTNDAIDSDANQTSGTSPPISINVEGTGKAKDNLDVDAGIIGNLGTIGDFVWQDNNGNGKQDGTEPGVAGIKVILYKNGVKVDSVNTDATGKYLFSNLTDGKYKVQFVLSDKNTQKFTKKDDTTAGTDDTNDSDADVVTGFSQEVTIDVTKPETDLLRKNLTLDAGIIPLGSIGDFVFRDGNGNNKQDAGESGVAGIKVILYKADGVTKVDSAITDVNGKYLFKGVESGGYKVRFVLPAGETFVTPNAPGTNSGDDSDAGVGGFSGVVTIDATQPVGNPARDNTTIDAGLKGNCPATAGTLLAGTDKCLPASGGVTLTATEATAPVIPAGYKKLYVLTKGTDLVIVATNNTPTFNVTTTGLYTIHTLIYNDDVANNNYLNLGVVVPGTTKAAEVLKIIADNKICAALDVTGAPFNVNPRPATPIFADMKNVCPAITVSLTAVTPTSTSSSFEWHVSNDINSALVANQGAVGAGTYYVFEKSNKGCVSDGKPVVVTITACECPNPVTVSINPVAAICEGSKINLTAVGNANVTGYTWTASGAGVFTSTTNAVSIYTPSAADIAAGSVTFTVVTNDPDGTATTCVPASATVSVTINKKPTTPAFADMKNVCPAITVSLTAVTPTSTSSSFEWHVSNDINSALVANQSAVGAGTYYVFEKSNKGCVSDGKPVVVTITACECPNPVTVSINPVATICEGSKINLTAVGNANVTGYTWTASGAGVFTSSTTAATIYTPTAAEIAAGSVTFTVVTNDPDGTATTCVPASATVSVTITKKPVLTDAALASCAGSPVTVSATGTAATYQWYSFQSSQIVGAAITGATASSFTPSVAEFPSAGGVFYYAVIGKNGSCADTAFVKVTIGAKPVVAVTGGSTICAGGSTSLSASSIDATQIKWYTVATGGTAFQTSNSGQAISVNPTVTTIYYAEGVTGTCVGPREAVTVTVNPKPASPTLALSSVSNVCPATTANLSTVATTAAGNTLEWHNANNTLASSLVSNVSALGAGTYYVFAKSAAGCFSESGSVTVNINNCSCTNPATIQIAQLYPICAGTTASLTATLGGGATSVTWTTTGTGTFSSSSSLTPVYTPSAADLTAGSVELTATTNDPDGTGTLCSAASQKVTLVIKAVPTTYTLRCDTLICLGKSTKLFAIAPGYTVKWYDAPTGGNLLGVADPDNGLIVTPTVDGISTYWAEAQSPEGCTTTTRKSISVRVQKCLTDLAVIKTILNPSSQYAKDDVFSYQIEAKNLGPNDAKAVVIKDVLPAGVTFVSASGGTYNTTTGEWAVGDLATNTNKFLLITVKINTTGTITNTAEILTNTFEDQTKLTNNKSTVTITAEELANLNLKKIVSNKVPNTGDQITYTITVGNNGPNAATNVEVTDLLPAGLEFVSSTSMTFNSGVVSAKIPALAKGATVDLTFIAKVKAAGKIKNYAQISKVDQKDPNSTPGNLYGTGGSIATDEDDDDNVEIDGFKTCTLPAPVIDCAKKEICLGETTTLTATGCAGVSTVWSDGSVGTTITVKPLINTTYSAYCKDGDCQGNQSNTITVRIIVVSASLLSAAPSRICAGSETTLTATACGGTVEWQTSPKQTGVELVVKPTVTTEYKAVCIENGCKSPMATVKVEVTPKPEKPVILCSKEIHTICPGESMTLTALNCDGQVKWSNNQETTTITVRPEVTSTYTVTCTVNGCVSEVSDPFVITVKPVDVPTISVLPTSICPGGKATLTATGCTGSVKWSNGQIGAQLVVSPNTTTNYTATCSTISCTSDKSTAVTVKVENPAPPIVSTSTSTICKGSSVQLSAIGCDGTVTWSNGATGATVTVSPETTSSYKATCKIGECVSPESNSISITVTNFAKPTVTADVTTICAGGTVTLTSNGCNGTVKWSDGQTGTTVTVKPTVATSYSATCESTTCKSDKSNEVKITVNDPGQAPVISCNKTEVCPNETVTLSAVGCTGTVKWSDGQTGATISVKLSTTTTYSAKCVVNNCESAKSNDKIITVKPVSNVAFTASADKDKVCANTEVTLTAAGCGSAVKWSSGQTTASIKVTPSETTTYTITCAASDCAIEKTADVKVTVLPGATTPTIASSGTGTICPNTEVTLTARNCNGTLEWSTGATNASITVKPSVTTSYTVKCSVVGCGDPKVSDALVITVGNPATPTVKSSESTVCTGGLVTLTADGCGSSTVVWSNGKTGASITETLGATTTFSAICKAGTCNGPESNKITVVVANPAVPTISCSTNTICPGSKVTFIGNGCEGTVKWSDGQTGTIVTMSPSVTTNYTAICKIGNCESAPSSVATLNVGNPPAPIIACELTTVCAGTQITLTAKGCDGTVVWNDGQVGTVVTAKPNATTSYSAICKSDLCESTRSNVVTVTVGAGINVPKTKELVNVCPFKTVNLASGVTSTITGTGGVFEYRTGALPTSALVSNPSAVGTTGTYYVFEKSSTGCYSGAGVINVFIANCDNVADCKDKPATVSAGPDQTLCAEKIAKLNATFGGAATSVRWKTTGTGTFDNPLLPNASYRSSLADVLAGSVKLIVCTNDPDGAGACKAAYDTLVVTIQGVKFKPTITVKGQLNACGTDTVTLTAVAGYKYKWFKLGDANFTATAQTIRVTAQQGGGYYYKVVDNNNCCSIESDTATIRPVVASLPVITTTDAVIKAGKTADLTQLVKADGSVIKELAFKVGPNATSADVVNPKAVGVGTYYLFYTSGGCKFNVGKIVVTPEIVIGTPNEADLVITIDTENRIAIDSTVKVTITVKNNGPATAKNVVVNAPVPSNLIFVSQTGGLVLTGTTLKGTLDSLVSGGVKVYTYIGKLKGALPVTVTGTVTSTTPDPNTGGTGTGGTGGNNGGSVVITAPPANSADVIVTITTDKTNYAKGDTVTTTIKVRNLGPATAKGITVTSAIPSGLTYVSQTGGLVKNGSILTASIDSLVKNGEKIYIYKSIVNGTGPVTITVGTTTTTTDPNPGNGNSTVIINQGVDPNTGKANVTIAIITDKSTYAVGDTVITTVTVKNNGPATAKDIVINIPIPGSLKFLTVSGGLVFNNGVVVGKIDSLVKDGVKVFIIKSIVTTAGPITIGGTITGGNLGSGSVTTTTTVINNTPQTTANVTIAIKTDKLVYAVGDTVTTTVTITNNGPATARNLNITIPIPGTLRFLTVTGGLVFNNGVLVGKIDSLVKDGVKIYVIKSIMTSIGQTTIGGSVTGSNLGSGSTTTTSTVINQGKVDPNAADVAIVITADKSQVLVNTDVKYTITVTNNGLGTAKDVIIKNLIPSGVTYVGNVGTPTLTKSGDTLRTKLDSLVKGATVTYAYTATVKREGDIVNNTNVTSKLDGNSLNDLSSVTIRGITETPGIGAELALTLTANKQLIAINDTVTFTIKVRNNGPATATDVIVNTLLSKKLMFIDGAPAKLGDTLRVTIPSITNGTTREFTYKAKVLKDTVIATTSTIAKSSPVDPILTNNSSTVILVPKTSTDYADLAIVMTANKERYALNEEVTYTVKVTNNGGGEAKEIEIRDLLPAGLQFVSGQFTKSGDTLKAKIDTTVKVGRTVTLTYKAKATQTGRITNTVNIAKASKPDVILTNNFSSATIVVGDTPGEDCKLGLTLAIVDTVKKATGVYDIKYQLIAKNFCKDTLKNMALKESLLNTFKTPVNYTFVDNSLTKNASSALVLNNNFNAKTDSLMVSGGTMAPNKVDTLTFVVNVTLNGQKGPFFTQAEIQGTKKDNTVVKAKSSAGSDINDENKKPTGLTFGLPNTRIGLAKEVVSKTLDSTNYWTVSYNIFVTNLGNNNITNLSVTDSLDKVFTNKGAKVVSVKTSGEPGITIDSTYTGQGLNVNLLKPSASVLDVGKTAKIGLVVRVNTSAATDSIFSNVAIGKGADKDGVSYTDISTKGKNPDPNFDGNPNENEATPVTLNGKATQPSSNNIGLAMKADTAKQADGSYNVTYTLRAINYGKVGLRNIRLCDTLKKEFGEGVQYTMVGSPMVVRGTMKADSTFNGDGKVGLLVSDTTKVLAPGDSIAVKFTVNIAGNSRTDEILNRAVVKAQTVTDKKEVFDISTNGINPDVAGDGPSNDSTPTPIKLPKRDLIFFIPDGFSPNGDTRNDTFVVEGVPSDESVTLQVYNRWGNVVYGKENYNGDWSGQSNLGVRLSDGALPDGSYLICVERKKKADPAIALKPIFKMITLIR